MNGRSESATYGSSEKTIFPIPYSADLGRLNSDERAKTIYLRSYSAIDYQREATFNRFSYSVIHRIVDQAVDKSISEVISGSNSRETARSIATSPRRHEDLASWLHSSLRSQLYTSLTSTSLAALAIYSQAGLVWG